MSIIRKKTIAASLIAAAAMSGSAVAQLSPLANSNRESVQFSQLITAGRPLQLGAPSASAQSRSYTMRVTGAELARGVDVVTEAPGAVIRMTPAGAGANGKAGLRSSEVEVSANGGAPIALDQSGALVAEQEDLKASNPELFENTLAFKASDAMGKGRFRLKSKGKPQTGDYVIQVFDKNSDKELSLSAPRQTYFVGDALVVSGAMANAGMKQGAKTDAVLEGPNGQRFKLNAAQKGGKLDISGALPSGASFVPGELWRVEVSYRENGGAPLYRDAVLAISVGEKSAGVASLSADKSALNIGVNVKSAGRYEARAIIVATNASGQREEAMQTSTASWLDAGARTLTLAPDTEQLTAAGYSPPFTVTGLQLLDQSRLMALETQSGGALATIGQ